jgi:uncharacterized protein
VTDVSTELFHAVIRGDGGLVEQALRAGANPNATYAAQWTFTWNVRAGAAEATGDHARQFAGERRALEQILQGGPDPTSQTRRSRTPLLLAAEFGETEILERLLQGGADGSFTDEDGWNAALFAVRRNDGDLLRAALRGGADPNGRVTGGLSALFLAARAGFAEGVRRLLEAGATPGVTTEFGLTPLMAAASFGHLFISGGPFYPGERHLIEEAMTRPGGRVKPQHLACLEMLLDAGADANAVGHGNPINQGDTALKFAALTGVFTGVHLLLNANADVNYSGGILATAFMCAVCSGKEPTVAYLRERGADPHETSADGLSALMCAARSGHTHLVHYLLDAGAAVDARRDDGETALFFAVNGGHVATARALIERGARVDARDDEGRTPLMLAAHLANPDLVQLLLNEGADVHLRSGDGRTALGWSQAEEWQGGDEETGEGPDIFEEMMAEAEGLTEEEEAEMLRQLLGDITGEDAPLEASPGDEGDDRLRVQRLLRFAGGAL